MSISTVVVVLGWSFLFLLIILLTSKINELEKKIKNLPSNGTKYWFVGNKDEDNDINFTKDEIKHLKEFTKSYLKKDLTYHVLGYNPNLRYLTRNIEPLHKYQFSEFVNEEFKELKELVLYPEKLEKEHEKIRLKKEIEEKEKELEEME